MATYTIKPQLRIDRTTPFYSVTKFRDAEPIEMDVYANNEALIIVPFWYGKEQYRNQNIRSIEAVIAITRKESLRTMNEDLEIKTCTISADKIKTDVLSISSPDPILCVFVIQSTRTNYCNIRSRKDWWKECCGGSETERGLRAEIPTLDDWNGEMSAILTFSPEKIDEIMNKLVGNEERKKCIQRI